MTAPTSQYRYALVCGQIKDSVRLIETLYDKWLDSPAKHGFTEKDLKRLDKSLCLIKAGLKISQKSIDRAVAASKADRVNSSQSP